MADEYSAVKRGKLILKGDKPKSKKRKHKKEKKEETSKVDQDCLRHGGWWQVEKIEDITGSISIEFGNGTYISALDNGLFTIGAPHGDGEGPSPEEIFTAFPAGDNKFALKSGYGKYIGVSKDGVVTGRSDAVGPMEQWEPVWQDDEWGFICYFFIEWMVNLTNPGVRVIEPPKASDMAQVMATIHRCKSAILSSLNKFMSVKPDDDSLVADSIKAGDYEFCSIRSNKSREVAEVVVAEEEGDLNEVELNYVKKFQKFQDKKIKLNDGGVVELKRAKNDGNLHETLLDRRSKMKADRYCK